MFKTNIMLLYLTGIQLENFRCFKKEQELDFSKLTILTGANSSGKSSILHAILGAVQSDEMPFRYSPNGKYTNMGDFNEMVNNHKQRSIIKIGLNFYAVGEKTNYHLVTTWKRDPKNLLPTLDTLNIDAEYLNLSIIHTDKGYTLKFSYNPDKDTSMSEEDKKMMIDRSWNMFYLRLAEDKTGSKKKINTKVETERFKEKVESYFKKVGSLTISDIPTLNDIRSYTIKKGNARLINLVDLIIPNMLNNFDHTFNLISSFRLHPNRTYLETSRDKIKIDKFGEGYLDQIMIWERNNPKKFQELEDVMKDLNLLTSLKSFRIRGGRYEVQLTPNKESVPAALPDVGFGLSQFLPIIVADLQLPNESTLMIAEPEIHLHPNVQANFGDYLIKQVKKKGKRYIIETHSEYLLNRIRLGIVKGEITPDDLSIYFLENDGKDVVVHDLIFTKQGGIKNAPKSFFDTYMMDLKEIAFNAEI